MEGHLFGLIELLLVFGLVLGIAWWELRSLRRPPRPPAAGKPAGDAAGDKPPPDPPV
ncbi:hypothetical protein AACH06_10600 [Ideonella sp. DXS29W]|uniref:Uncharacterized protein n=1 Tax=Ideonella lacteola TaxID=2984193 RepID=A0ABU9BN34_9BURK